MGTEIVGRRAGPLLPKVFTYRAVERRRDADPYGGDVLGATGDPGLHEALARLLGPDGAVAVLADEARELLRGRRGGPDVEEC